MTLNIRTTTYLGKENIFQTDSIYKEISVTGEQTSNAKLVKVKKERNCYNCTITIKSNSEAYSFNPYKRKRYWICLDCLPKPNNKLIKKVGEEGILYSSYKDNLGNYLDIDTIEKLNLMSDLEDRLYRKIQEDVFGIGQD